MDVTTFYLIFSAALFSVGAIGVLVRQNTIVMLMCVELMLNASNIALVALSRHFGTLDGQIYVIFIMTVAAAEVAVGLAIVISVFRTHFSVRSSDFQTLQG